MALLCRTLHNFSDFAVRSMAAHENAGSQTPGRYQLHPHMSDYYRLLRTAMGGRVSDERRFESGRLFYPCRTFDPTCLLTADGESVIAALTRIADGILIEDSDLTREVLLDHVRTHACNGVLIFDLSRALRLSVNHVYWVTAAEAAAPPKWEQIWPR